MMPKLKKKYVCQQCGTESTKWMGKCNGCGEWNTFVEELVEPVSARSGGGLSSSVLTEKPVSLPEVQMGAQQRILSGIGELDRVTGGGFIPGSVLLIGGDPGIGKSTLSLQIAKNENLQVLYVSGEESKTQIKHRAERIGVHNPRCFLLSEVLVENVIKQIEEVRPDLVIIDSIQTLYSHHLESSPGTITQIRECAVRLMKIGKKENIPIVLIGHINKDGNLAGPKVLEHIVDVVLQFEGDQNFLYRVLRVHKNRYGATSELAIFEMREQGLREIKNPSEVLITQYEEPLSGIAIGAIIDGNRPFLVESQSLVSSAVYGTPQRSSTGYDLRRLNMLLAVLEKKAGFKIGQKDVFLNIAGGIKVVDPALDLAIAAAILSSSVDVPLDRNVCFIGEIGLSGEIRPVMRVEQRIEEARKIGFQRVFISKYNKKQAHDRPGIEIQNVSRIDQLLKKIF